MQQYLRQWPRHFRRYLRIRFPVYTQGHVGRRRLVSPFLTSVPRSPDVERVALPPRSANAAAGRCVALLLPRIEKVCGVSIFLGTRYGTSKTKKIFFSKVFFAD